MCCDIVDWQERMHYIDDALGMCAGLSSFPLKPPYHIHNYPKFISSGAGIDMDEETAHAGGQALPDPGAGPSTPEEACAEKTTSLPRTIGRSDFPSLKRSFWTPITQFKGWNEQGIPTEDSLHELGLDYVFEEFEKRGVYSESGRTVFPVKPRRKRTRRCSRDH